MRLTTRTLALAVGAALMGSALLAGCGHKDKDAPLAFVPADTPYVVANLDVLDDDTRKAILAQADAQLPAQIVQINNSADELAAKDPDTAHLLHALTAELGGKSIETFADNAGLDIKGHSAFYGLGLAPVMRLELADPAKFESFIGRLETAYGKKFDVATVGGQSYRKHVSAQSGTEAIIAIVGKQAVAAVLPADASEPLLRQALGLDRPEQSLLDDGRLDKLAKDKGYQAWAVGEFDLTRALPLAASGKDPLFSALLKAHAQTESAQTGEPVANQLQIPASCGTDAARIAARVPQISFGYTKLDAGHQDMRWDIAVADDISKAFAGIKVELPGLGADADAPFDMSLALPMATLRTFWGAQADAVAAKPFTCPALSDLNDTFAKLGPAMQKAAVPPIGDLLGLRIALDSFAADPNGGMPKFAGRVVLGTNNPAGLLAMGQMAVPALSQVKLGNDGKPAPLPANMTAMLGQPVWAAMGEKSLALAIGAGEDAKLGDTLKAPGGDAGRMLRMHLSGDMYSSWIAVLQQKADSMAAMNAAMGHDPSTDPNGSDDVQKAAARTKAQFAAMQAQAARIKDIAGEAHMEDGDVVLTSQTVLK